jgi:hypothetical protein
VARSVADLGRWLAARPPRDYLIAGWVVFVLNCYPGYLSFNSSMQLFAVRNGDYTDYAPVMTGIWSLLEWVAAGPFPMLVLQSGLFLFGLYAILRKLLAPRAAALVAAGVLLFPPVFSPLAVIWPDSLMAGALLAATGALLEDRLAWKITGGVLLAIACACKPEIVLAIAPLVFLGLPAMNRWKRVGLALGVVIAVALVARVANLALTDDDHHTWHQDLMVTDLAGTLHRAHVTDPAPALAGLRVVDATQIVHGVERFDPFLLVSGANRVIDPIATDEQQDSLSADWRAAVGAHPRAYISHRYAMFRRLIATTGRWVPIYDNFGDAELLAPLHHRASPSDWQDGWNAIVHLLARTPLFRPWLYLLLAIVAIVLTRRQRLLRNLAISGLAYELALFVFAATPDYRFSHWLVTTATIAIVAHLVSRKAPLDTHDEREHEA